MKNKALWRKMSLFVLLLPLFYAFSCGGGRNVVTGNQQSDSLFVGIEQFKYSGVEVLSKKSNNDVVVAQLYIKGGLQNVTDSSAGIEKIMMETLVNGGTERNQSHVLSAKLDAMGSKIEAFSGLDYSVVTLTSLKKFFAQSWDLFSQVILEPAFDQNVFNKVRNEQLEKVFKNQNNPDFQLPNYTGKVYFGGQQYEKIVLGSTNSIEKISLNDVKAHYKKIFRKDRMLLVVVGDVPKSSLEGKIQGSLAYLPDSSESFFQFEESTYYPDKKVGVKAFNYPTNLVRGVFPAPKPGTDSSNIMRIALELLEKRLQKNVKFENKENLPPRVKYHDNLHAFASITFAAYSPNLPLIKTIETIKDVKVSGFTEEELANERQLYLTHFYLDLETNQSMANYIGHTACLGNWKESIGFHTKILEISVDEVNAVFLDYCKKISWVYLGDPQRVGQEIFYISTIPE